MTVPLETERKFHIEPGVRTPALGELADSGEQRNLRLNATYFDTPDLQLARNAITLRRRTGGGDAGWHLKLPRGGDERLEVHEPIVRGASTLIVPAPLRAQVAEVIGYAPLVPVANLHTRRTEIELVQGKNVLATLCDDTVTATRGQDQSRWRELEVELAGGDQAFLDAVTARFAEDGVPVAESVSKLVQALGTRLAEAESARLTRKSSAADVLSAYFAAQVGMIQGREAEVRVDAPDAVHKMRVACRRLRSVLRTFRPMLDREITDPIRVDLKWLGEMLGGPRDAEVLRDHLLAEIERLPTDAIVGPVRERLNTELLGGHDTSHAELVAALDSPRYRRLLEALVNLLATPPFNEYAAARARGVLPPLLDRAAQRTLKMWKRAKAATSGEEQLLLWHETRKLAKAARYAWEAMVPAFNEQAVAPAAAWEQFTETLGIVQDTVVSRERLHDLATAAHRAGEPTFTYGVLWTHEVARAEAASVAAADAVSAAKRASDGS